MAAAPLVRLGLLKVKNNGRLDVTGSDPNAIKAVAAEVNYHYANPQDLSGTHNAEHMRAQVLNVLAHVNTSGSAPEVSARLGAAIGHLSQFKMLPQTIAQSAVTAPPATSEMDSMYNNLAALVKSDAAAAIFADARALNSALAKTQRTAKATTEQQIAAGLQAEPIGARVGKDGKLENASDTDFVNRAKEITSNSTIADMIVSILKSDINLKTITSWINQNIPVPLTPLLLRHQIVLRTAGMILATRGAQRTYYSRPLFSWEDDGAQQVTRGVLSFYSGAFVEQENRIYHARDVLIVGVESGFDCTFRKADVKDDTGSIISVLEPGLGRKHYQPLITAYGSWGDMSIIGRIPKLKDMNKTHFAGKEFVKKAFNIVEESAPSSEMEAAYAGVAPPDANTMWLGAARYYDSVAGKAGDIQHGAGPLASYDFYDRGMFKAWADGTAYPLHKMVAASVQ